MPDPPGPAPGAPTSAPSTPGEVFAPPPSGSTAPGSTAPGSASAAGVPNPAAPERHGDWRADDMGLSRPARRLVKLADALPDWMGSIRFRLTALYSLVLFALAAFMVAGLYAILAARLDEEKVYVNREVTIAQPVPGGIRLTPAEIRQEYRSVEALAYARALSLLRSYSASALALLFLASLGVGWMVAGRVLAPIGRITAVARDIQATDLSRRIALRGPPDELKELADTFDAMLSRLDEAFEGQQRFIQEASHELRNPLAVIRTNLDVTLADPDADADELRQTAELVGRSAERMSRLVDDLLVYARRGALAHDIGPCDIAEVVAAEADEFRAMAQARHLTVVTSVAPGLVVEGDVIALRRALANLLTNAIRLAPERSTVQAGAGRSDEQIWMQVTDEGPGISEDQRALVFRRFWRGDQRGAQGAGRSGLGLAIVEQIARDHGGSVQLDATPVGGSAFTIWLPATGPGPVGPPADAARTVIPGSDHGSAST